MVSRVQHISFYARTSPTPPVDRHGKQPNPHATEITIRQQIHEHIKSFSTVQSHYGRAKKNKREEIFLLIYVNCYHVWALPTKHETEEYAMKEDRKFHITYEYYREYFNIHFNLGFGVPSSDTWCN